MTPIYTTHLSDEALDDLLIGLGSSESTAHLAGCEGCRAKVTAFQSDIDLFNSASIAWSQSRPLRPVQSTTRKAAVRPRLALLSWAATAIVLVVTGVAIWHHQASAPLKQAQVIESQPSDSEAQIAQDNQLLQEVNAAISPDEESLIEQYQLTVTPDSHRKAHNKLRTK